MSAILQLYKNLKIGVKLTIGLGILVALTLLVVGLSYFASAGASDKIETTAGTRAPTALTSSRAQANLLRMLSDVRGYLALGEAEYRDSYHQSAAAFEADLAELKGLSTSFTEEDRRRLEELESTYYEEWSQLPDQLFELRDDQLEREPAYRLLATDGLLLGGTVLIDTADLIDSQGRQPPTEQNIALLADMAKFQGTFAAMLSGLRGYVTTRNRTFRGEYEANLAANEFAWDRLQSQRSYLTLEQQEVLGRIAENRAAFLLLPDQMFDLLESERWREDLYLFKTEAVPMATRMAGLLDQITAEQQRLLQADLNEGNAGLGVARLQTLVGGAIAIVFGVAMSFFLRENISSPVRRLTAVAEQIRGGDLEAQARVESRDEIGILATTFNNMTAQLRQTLLQVRKEKKRADDLLEVVIPIGIELASEKDFNRLLEKMLIEAKTFCNASAGTLYLRTRDDRLEYVILRDDVQQMALGGTTGQAIPFAPLPLYDEQGTRNDRYLAVRVVLDGDAVNISDADRATEFDFSGPDGRIVALDERATSILAIPLENSAGDVLGVMQLVDARDSETDQAIAFDQNLQQMMESFSSLAVAALEAYIREQELRKQIQQLRIEIDQAKKARQVAEITETDYFQDLRKRAQDLRAQARAASGEPTSTE